jgi:hypothetical protein
MMMEQAPLIESAVKVIFCGNDVETGRHPELFRSLFASGDLEIAFAVAEAHLDLQDAAQRAASVRADSRIWA